ncbi:diacylglyceryl transferase [Cystobacter fuscus]|uniref:Diacylglyceryl transferase n=1 Tax=Cystobacter fuscus TaxID=43 RepID=A0A250J5F2_9BACT|nr:prolipoprotein diacylglyceryl transferase family protein [Cystobacter fuscus]ATB38833.1 diacylglyceryl transferase [Cystobacter fuscus]
MTFPLYIPLGPWQVHPHVFFETLAYFLGARLYFVLKRRWADPLQSSTRLGVIAGAALGAGLGSRLVHLLDEWPLWLAGQVSTASLLTGKSLVGGLLGGLLGVELAKKLLGEQRSTGDLFVLPLCLGIFLGRLGCFFTGLDDHTYGVATSLPWGVDFGDGVSRHPTQLYEAAFMVLVAALSLVLRGRELRQGDLFRRFMVLDLTFRLGVDLLKPDPRPLLGLSGIQWVCVAGLLYYARDLPRLWLRRPGLPVQGDAR